MREHCRDVHHWKNPQKRGGQCKDGPKSEVDMSRVTCDVKHGWPRLC